MAQTARQEDITGASLSGSPGSSGSAGRTYTLNYGGVNVSTIVIHVQGAYLHSADYSIASGVVTFNIAVWDDQVINIYYYTDDGQGTSTAGQTDYITTLQFAQALGMKKDVPSWEVGSTPSNEDVGASPGASGKIYLDHRNILSGSYYLYTGGTTSATATTLMTESTHYTLDKTTGEITVTSTGHTLIGGTNHVFAKYSYVDTELDFSDSYLATVISRAEKEVDSNVNSTFTDGTATNPAYPAAVDKQTSWGLSDRRYKVQNMPLKDVTSELASNITSSSNTLSVTSGEGRNFPLTGTIVIGNEIITYTNVSTDTLTGLTRGANGSTAAAHTAGDDIHTTVIEISNSSEGRTPSWRVMAWDSEMHSDEYGNLYIYENGVMSADQITNQLYPYDGTPNRLRATYLYGYDTIPEDIQRLTIIIAKRMLIADNIGKSMIAGRNEFRPEMFNADMQEMTSIINNYRILEMDKV
jgi:hypothetical protein